MAGWAVAQHRTIPLSIRFALTHPTTDHARLTRSAATSTRPFRTTTASFAIRRSSFAHPVARVLVKTSDPNYDGTMKRVPIAEFKAHCSHYIEHLDEEGILITKHGKPVARVVADEPSCEGPWQFVGAMKGDLAVDADDDFLSTDVRWDAQS